MNINLKNTKFHSLVLSGGSIKGIYLLGAIKFLEEKNIINNIKYYGGTSIGAIITLLLMIGYKSIEIFTAISCSDTFEKINNQTLYVSAFNIITYFGIYDFENICEIIKKMIIKKIGYIPTLWKLEKITKKRYYCTTYNLSDKITEYISARNYPNLNVIDALHMTANLPIMFDKFNYNNKIYIDGGFSDNFPIKYMEKFSRKEKEGCILGIIIDKLEEKIYKNVLEYFIDIILTVPYIGENKNIEEIKRINNRIKILKIKNEKKIKITDFKITFNNKCDCFLSGYNQLNDYYIKKYKKD